MLDAEEEFNRLNRKISAIEQQNNDLQQLIYSILDGLDAIKKDLNPAIAPKLPISNDPVGQDNVLKRIYLTLDAITIAKAKDLGDGNVSLGVRIGLK